MSTLSPLRRRAALIVSCGTLVLAPCAARAQSEERASHAAREHAEAREEEEHESHFHLGFASTVTAGVSDTGTTVRYGPGMLAEFLLVPHWLELEAFVRVMGSAEEGVALPIDVQLEVPFEVCPWFHPFIALGPTIAPTFRSEGNEAPFGGAASIGAQFRVAREYALLVEANYNLLYNQGALEHEAGGTVGALVGF